MGADFGAFAPSPLAGEGWGEGKRSRVQKPLNEEHPALIG
jgi:hypothetical protein